MSVSTSCGEVGTECFVLQPLLSATQFPAHRDLAENWAGRKLQILQERIKCVFSYEVKDK